MIWWQLEIVLDECCAIDVACLEAMYTAIRERRKVIANVPDDYACGGFG